jgi:UDP:flavonoid glycosyltransferase YjiC (YdhE family)
LHQAEELARRGWRAIIAACENMRPHLDGRAPGVSFRSLGDPPNDVAAQEELLARLSAEPSFVRGSMVLMAALGELWPGTFDAISTLVRDDRPDLMVVDYAATAGVDVAEAAGIQVVVNNPDLLTVLPTPLFPPVRRFAAASLGDVGARHGAMAAADQPAAAPAGRGGSAAHHLSRGQPQAAHARPHARRRRAAACRQDHPGQRRLPAGPGNALLEHLVRALDGGEVRALWIMRPSVRARLPPSLPPRLRLEPWVPSTLALLTHPQVRAFVSHSGVNSVTSRCTPARPLSGCRCSPRRRTWGCACRAPESACSSTRTP